MRMSAPTARRKRIVFFGNFDASNFGNECTLQAILYHLRGFYPDAEASCISTGPAATVTTHNIAAIPISQNFFKSWSPQNSVTRILRKACVALLNEPYQWATGLLTLRRTDMFVVPGTGLFTDAYGLFSWGPYSLFRWSVAAKICRCKVVVVGIGAGPLSSLLGRWFAKSVLSVADFRSYRDGSTARYLCDIGFRADRDPVYPDLAFSLPVEVLREPTPCERRRPVVGLGVMTDGGMRGGPGASAAVYSEYLETLATFVKWLLDRGYDVRLLIGDVGDRDALVRLRNLMNGRLAPSDAGRVLEEEIGSVEDLLRQIGSTDIVVATRFHNVLLACLSGKPVIAMSFHPKCASLMDAMDLTKYCVGIDALRLDGLIELFCDVETNSDALKTQIKSRTTRFRSALDQQYRLIFKDL